MLLLWAYYSSQILLLGGELVRAYARSAGSRIEPTNQTVKVSSAGTSSIELPRKPVDSKSA